MLRVVSEKCGGGTKAGLPGRAGGVLVGRRSPGVRSSDAGGRAWLSGSLSEPPLREGKRAGPWLGGG